MSKLNIGERTKHINPSKIREVFTKVQSLADQGIEVANFSIGRPDFDTPEHIKEATRKALAEGKVHYASSAGIIELREAICYRMKEDYALQFDPDEVIITGGASQANYIATQTILNPGDEVIVPEPMYVYYSGWSYLGGAKCVSFPIREEDNFIPNAVELEKYITSKTKAIILTSPHNPTGVVYGRNCLLELAKLAKKYDFYVISDDIYNKMLYDNVEYFNIASIDGMKERTIVIGSFSKTYAMDGWRVGYLIAPKGIISGAMKIHQHTLTCVNTFVQYGAVAALMDSQESVGKMVNEFDRRRLLILSYLDKMSIPYVRPRGAFYVFPNIKQFGFISEKFCDFLLDEARVAVVPGNAFGQGGEGYIRIADTVPYEVIEEGMERFKKAVQKLH